MKKLLTFCALFTLGFNSRAALVEYPYTGSQTFVGGGSQVSRSYTGLMIYDNVATNVTFVSWRGDDKTYKAWTVTNFHFTVVSGPGSANCTVITSSSSGVDTNDLYYLNDYMIKGVNKQLNIATGQNFSFPASFSGSNNRSISPDTNGVEYLETWSETMVFSEARTVADNNHGLTAAQVAANEVSFLQSHGYTLR